MSMRQFASFDELFQFIWTLIEQLENAGHAEAAAAVREGYASLNGLTDGWAMLLEGIVQARKQERDMAPELRAHLVELQAVVRKMVYR